MSGQAVAASRPSPPSRVNSLHSSDGLVEHVLGEREKGAVYTWA